MNINFLTDRLLIEDLVNRYALSSDSLNPELYHDIFTKDAQILMPNGKIMANGFEAIITKAQSDQTRFRAENSDQSVMRHVITNLVTTIEGNTAVANYYVITLGYDAENKQPAIASFARYQDQCIKQNDQWLIQKRTMFYDWGNDDMARKLEIGPYTPEKYKSKN